MQKVQGYTHLWTSKFKRESGLETLQPNFHQSNDQNSCKHALEKTSKFSKACSSKGPEGSLVMIESYKGSQCLIGFERQNPLVSDASNSVSRTEETPPDEQSDAVGHNDCSRKHDDIDDSTYLSDVSGTLYSIFTFLVSKSIISQ